MSPEEDLAPLARVLAEIAIESSGAAHHTFVRRQSRLDVLTSRLVLMMGSQAHATLMS